MTITLTAEQEKIIQEQIGSGNYHSPEDVIGQSLGMLRAQEEFIRSNTAKLRDAIREGLDEIKRGEVVDGPAAITMHMERLKSRLRGQ
jgi:putative addiction module CopG family antidote